MDGYLTDIVIALLIALLCAALSILDPFGLRSMSACAADLTQAVARVKFGLGPLPFYFLWPLSLLMALLLMPFMPTIGAIAMLCSLLVVAFDLSVLASVRRRRFKRRLLSVGFRICRGCLYSLQGLTKRGNCPECGLRYDVEALEALWRTLFYTKVTK